MRAAVVLIIAIVGGTNVFSLMLGKPTDYSANYLEDDYSSEESDESGHEDNEIPVAAPGILFGKKTSELPMISKAQFDILQQLFQAKQESEQKINAFRQKTEAAKKDSEQNINNLQQLLGQLSQKESNNALPKLTMRQRMESVETIIEYNSAKQVTNCPETFVSIDGGCYHFNSYDLKDWNEALKKCQALESGSSLVSIESQDEWDSIRNYLTENKMDTKNWWIGGSDQEVEGSWKWAATHQPIEYSDWCQDEPNNHDGIEDCALIAGPAEGFNRDRRLCWNDFPCRWDMALKLPLQFICEIKNN